MPRSDDPQAGRGARSLSQEKILLASLSGSGGSETPREQHIASLRAGASAAYSDGDLTAFASIMRQIADLEGFRAPPASEDDGLVTDPAEARRQVEEAARILGMIFPGESTP